MEASRSGPCNFLQHGAHASRADAVDTPGLWSQNKISPQVLQLSSFWSGDKSNAGRDSAVWAIPIWERRKAPARSSEIIPFGRGGELHFSNAGYASGAANSISLRKMRSTDKYPGSLPSAAIT